MRTDRDSSHPLLPLVLLRLHAVLSGEAGHPLRAVMHRPEQLQQFLHEQLLSSLLQPASSTLLHLPKCQLLRWLA
eukprot:COSAG02_NODE_6952_length_3266_cov_7.514683_4_plen_75_part_00